MADVSAIMRGGKVDPYYVWAEATDYAGMPLEGDKLPALIEAANHAAALALAHTLASTNPGTMVVPPVLAGCSGFTAYVDRHAAPALFAKLDAAGVRWELGLPFASPAAPFGESHGYPPMAVAAGQVVGFIDYGCAFAHRQFRAAGGGHQAATRVFALWDQGGDWQEYLQPAARSGLGLLPPSWRLPRSFRYGAEWRRHLRVAAPLEDDRATDSNATKGADLLIDQYIAQFARDGEVDEEACYRYSGYTAVDGPMAHGTHIMDVATGRPDPMLAPGQAETAPATQDIVFVQLPRYFGGQQVSGLLRTYVLDAVNYIFSCARPGQPVTINLSYGGYTGPHDGSTIIEKALDDAIAARRQAGGPTDIVVAAGNGAVSDTHVQAEVAPGADAMFGWSNIPDNPTDQFAEVWLTGGDVSRCEVRFTAPGASPQPHDWVAAGGLAEVRRGSDVVARVIAPAAVPQGEHGRMVLVAVNPTVPRSGRAAAPYGRWTLEIRNRSTQAVQVAAWIERDDPVFPTGSGPRQARFEGPHLTSTNTLNSLGHGTRTILVGGYVGGSGRQLDYSGRGYRLTGPDAPCAADTRIDGKRPRPDWLAICEESHALPGIAAAGVIGSERYRLPGTSIASAAATRYVVNQRAANPGDTGAVAAPPSTTDIAGEDCMERVPAPFGS